MLTRLVNIFLRDSDTKKTRLIHIFVISALTVLVYLNIFQNTFILDDKTIFLNWPEVKSMNIEALIRGTYPIPFKDESVYRPIKSIIHSIDYNISGNSPIFYHLQTILVNLGITLLIYLIVYHISQKSSVSFFTSLLFGIHPIHTEAITYLTASFDTIGILFFFLSLYCYLKWEKLNNNFIYLISLLFAIAAFFTYELTLILPLILILYDYCFEKINKANFKKKLFHYTLLFITIGIFFILRNHFLNNSIQSAPILSSYYLTMLTMLKSLLLYIFLCLFPINLSTVQVLPGGIESVLGNSTTFRTIQAIAGQSIFEPVVLFAIFLIIISIWSFFRFRKKHPIASFCIGWFFVSLLPVLHIIPIRQIFSLRYEYIASFGIIFLFSYSLIYFYLSNKTNAIIKNALIFLFILIITIFSFLTFDRNFDWQTDFTLLKSLSNQKFVSYAANYSLGKYYFNKNNYTQSAYYLNKLILDGYDDLYKDAGYYLTLSYIKLGQFNKANTAYLQFVKKNPNYNPVALTLLSGALKPDNKQSLDKSSAYTNIQTLENFSFSYPKEWSATKTKKTILIENPKNEFSMQINYSNAPVNVSIQEYLKNAITYGNLKQQGQANIPSGEFSYAKIWDNNGTLVAQFFLFKDEDVLEIIASPFENENINNLNLVLNSIKFK